MQILIFHLNLNLEFRIWIVRSLAIDLDVSDCLQSSNYDCMSLRPFFQAVWGSQICIIGTFLFFFLLYWFANFAFCILMFTCSCCLLVQFRLEYYFPGLLSMATTREIELRMWILPRMITKLICYISFLNHDYDSVLL